VTLLVGVPIRAFDGMVRLAPVLDRPRRRRLVARLAARTLEVARAAGCAVAVVTGDPEVAAWAETRHVRVVVEPAGGGLDGAAAALVAAASPPWAVVHADLPLLGVPDLVAVAREAAIATVLAPSRDGGTSVVASTLPGFPFAYGPGSFARHLAACPGPRRVLVRPGLAFDLDRPADLAAAERLGILSAAPAGDGGS
jgi:2-phospho-L-lactate guanylyltransferase